MANHPTFLAVPDEVKAVSGPVLIQVGDSDAMMPIDQVNTAKEIFASKQNAEVTVFPGAVHGFSVGLPCAVVVASNKSADVPRLR